MNVDIGISALADGVARGDACLTIANSPTVEKSWQGRGAMDRVVRAASAQRIAERDGAFNSLQGYRFGA
jgi:hypothetical protein